MKRRIVTKKIDQKFSLKTTGKKFVICSRCNINEIEVSADAIGGICWRCLTIAVPPEKIDPTMAVAGSGRPRGWKWMSVFVDKDGIVFHRGVEQPKLKGTLPPTKIEKKSARQKFEEKEKKELKDTMKAAERYKKKKKEERQNGKVKTATEVANGGKKRGRPRKS